MESNSYLYDSKYKFVGDTKYPEFITKKLDDFYDNIREICNSDYPYEEQVKLALKALNDHIVPNGTKIDFTITKKSINKVVDIYDRILDEKEFVYYTWLLMNAGFLISTAFPMNVDEDSLILPDKFIDKRNAINSKFKEDQDKTAYMKALDDLAVEVLEYSYEQDNALGNFIKSGVNGSLTHLKELLLGVGFSLNSEGKIIDTITSSLTTGVTQTEYFNNSSQAIQALFSKSAETAVPGYLGKKLNNVAEKTKLSKSSDCGTTNGLVIKTANKKFLSKFVGRYYITSQKKLSVFKEDDVSKFTNKKIEFRSPAFCKSLDGVCSTCYDKKLIDRFELDTGANLGIMASTGMTNSLVNLTLKKSHVGVGVEYKDVDLVKEIQSM